MTPADYVIDLFKTKLQKRVDQATHLILSGGLEDYPRYRELAGELRAYSAALADAKEALKAATEDPFDE